MAISFRQDENRWGFCQKYEMSIEEKRSPTVIWQDDCGAPFFGVGFGEDST